MRDKSKHCSRTCHNKIAGIAGGRAGKGVSRGKGRKRPDLAERNRLQAKTGRENPNWKETGQAYSTIHLQVNKLFQKSKHCETCDSPNNLQWSNKDHTYTLEKDKWQTLCILCHKKYDKKLKNTTLI